jgi:putative monooxygenase
MYTDGQVRFKPLVAQARRTMSHYKVFRSPGRNMKGLTRLSLLAAGRDPSSIRLGVTVIPVGEAIPLHYHNCEEVVVVLEGLGVAEVERRDYELDQADLTWLEPGVIHRFRNRGEVPLRILWVYPTTSAERTIVATGETVPIG